IFSIAPPTPLQPPSISAPSFFGQRQERGWRGVGGAMEKALGMSTLDSWCSCRDSGGSGKRETGGNGKPGVRWEKGLYIRYAAA
ncbi:MAG: hypothetical protein IIU04_06725, partial [Bacteroidales bacterium]|nr:hypothetical protein [Bacteroidales bacterium]